MKKLNGVYKAQKKDGSIYYRSSITYKKRHISLGSFDSASKANEAYLVANNILRDDSTYTIDKLDTYNLILSFEKIVVLLNFRDNQIYFHSPIYLYKNYFLYYLSCDYHLTFDKDDLFYYSSHKIMKRGGHLFVADYGMQINIHSRYGIKNHAVKGRDYYFHNQDETDFRYDNIKIINNYYGVFRQGDFGAYRYKVKIHINGDFVIGTFDNEETAAIAYNKAADYCRSNGITKNYPINYIEGMSPKVYADIYSEIKLPKSFLCYFD